jgi:hypothetical protein
MTDAEAEAIGKAIATIVEERCAALEAKIARLEAKIDMQTLFDMQTGWPAEEPQA